MRFARTAVVSLLTSTIAIAAGPANPVSATTDPADTVFVSELHYDNASTDTGEAVEVFAPAGTDLTDWSLVLYNGNGGSSYGTVSLSGVVPDLGGGAGVLEFATAGLQNGSPDGLALVDPSDGVVQFLSYEGVMTAADGPAAGLESTDIGVQEPGDTPVGSSLQLAGTGSCYGALAWTGPAPETFGALGPITPDASAPCDGGDEPGDPSSVHIDELHYDNVGADVGEAVEIVGAAGTDVTGWTITLYNGSSSSLAPYGSAAFTGALTDQVGGVGTAVLTLDDFGVSGIQNGAPDGLALSDATGALVEFLSYEGAFTAVGGPADGVASTDIGVAEGSSTPIGTSLQRQADGTWTGPACASFGAPNDPAAPATCPEPPSVVLNELLVSTVGTDSEYVELYGAPLSSLAGLSLVAIEAEGTSAGTFDRRYDFPADATLGDNGFYLLANSTAAATYAVTPNAEISENYFENSSTTYALVETASIPASGLDGIVVVDSVALTSGAGTFYLDAPVVGPDGTFLPAGAGRIVDGVDTDTAADWQILDFSNGAPNSPTAGTGLIVTPPVTDAQIYEIQGTGFASPLVDHVVRVDGVVTADFQTGLSGFYIQEPDGGDGDATTSDGIFVYASTPDVEVGQVVTVTGTVKEHFDLTEISDVTGVEVTGTAAVPDPTPLVLPADDAAREAVEGMYVTLPQSLAISEYYNFGRYGEIVLSTDRQYQPTALYDPYSPEADQLAVDNQLERITLDDGRSWQNPDPAIHPNGDEFTLDNTFRGGDLVTNATGVVDYSFGLYRIQPTQGADFESVNPRPDVPAVGGNLKVSSFNVLNYFTTLTSAGAVCGPDQNQDCRGADTPEEFERQEAKIVAALAAIDADVVGLLEIENNGTAVHTLVDALNADLGDEVYAAIDTGTIGTDAISVAMIYKTATAVPVGDFAILDSTVDPRFDDTKNRPALAQTFSTTTPGSDLVTVSINHLKSKGSGCGIGDDDPVQGNCNLTRAEAADALGDWLNGDPTQTGSERFLIIGDLNAYDHEDPIKNLEADGYTDLEKLFNGEEAYSYVFDGQLGYLDYAMASPMLVADITGASAWHINADEPSILDYDMSFKQPAQDALYEPNPYRSSDHDPVLIGLDLCEADPPELDLWLSETVLTPPNHRMVTVDASWVATDGGSGVASVELVSVTSNEPDNGDDDGNTTDDIVIVDNDTFELRAERSGSGTGRVYTITYVATDHCGNTTTATAEVYVPLSPGRNR